MVLYDLKFDGGKGDADVTLSGGVIGIAITESNPSFPTGLQINIPLTVIFGKIISKLNNAFVGMMLNGVLAIVSAIP